MEKSNIITINEDKVKGHVDKMVRGTVEETLNKLLDAEADRLCGAERYVHSDKRKSTRSGHYERNLETKAGKVRLKVPKLRNLPFETAIIERYRRRESSIEEAMIEMYVAGVSLRRVEDITEALWGSKVSPATLSTLNQKLYSRIKEWLARPFEQEYPYVYLDGLWLKRSWGGEYTNVSLLVAIGVRSDGHREIIGITEGSKEDKPSWENFLKSLKSRGLKGVRLIVSDKCLGLVESLGETFPEAKWQRCIVHYYRNAFTLVPNHKMKEVTAMLKAIHAQEDKIEARNKAVAVVAKLKEMKLKEVAKHIDENIDETLTYMDFPREHWIKLRTNNPMERIMREIRRRTRVVGAFPDGESALMLAAARLRHISGSKWGSRKYLSMDKLKKMELETA